ncbi:MAG: AMP-binding protein [Clostridiales bacterium]|nr:AMP-binding protein [Clostridiales bacterium]
MPDRMSFQKYWDNVFADSKAINKDSFFITSQNARFVDREYTFTSSVGTAINRMSKGSPLAQYVILLAAVSYMLARYTDTSVVSLGVANFTNKNGRNANSVIPVVFHIDEEFSVKEWINYVKEVVLDAQKNTQYNIADYMDKNELVLEQFVNTCVSLEVDGEYNTRLSDSGNKTHFKFFINEDDITAIVHYSESVSGNMDYLIENLTLLCETFSDSADRKLSQIDVVSGTERTRIEEFNRTEREYDFTRNYYDLFKEQCEMTPDNVAVVDNGVETTYREIDRMASQISSYLTDRANIKPNDFVAILYPNSTAQIIATLAVLKSGAGFIPLDTDLPRERVKFIINNSSARVIIFPASGIKIAQDLLWECPSLERAFCADSLNVELEKEEADNMYMDKSLWEYVGNRSQDDISLGGWSSSYTGENFSKEEMNEYSQNAFRKLRPLLSGREKILEIGCGSGLTMFPLSAYSGEYHAIDLSQSTVDKDREKAKRENLTNIHISCYAAHEVLEINQTGFDLVIMNSVVQCFNGHNYLKQVIRDAVSMMKDKGSIFIGDVMDIDRKSEFEQSLRNYKKENPQARTKLDLSEELFLGREFFENLPYFVEGISEVSISPKIYTISNELTRYRFDVMLTIDKKSESKPGRQTKFLDCLADVTEYEYTADKPPVAGSLDDSAVVIYTSGTTGTPKGVDISYRSLLSLCFYSAEVFHITEKDRRAKNATFSFDASLWEVYPFLLKGASVYIVDPAIKLDLSAINNFFEKNHITIALFTTQVAEQFMKLKNRSLRYLIAGGEKLRRFYKNSNYIMMNAYGPTETTVVATSYIVTEDMENIPIGKPFPTMHCYIVDSKGRLQPLGARGELYIGGNGVGKGYVNMPDLTAERFVIWNGERIYKSGDYAYYRDDGNILFFGRRDKQLKINGYRVEVSEIEKHILVLDRIKEAVVLDFADAEGNKYLCCYYVAADDITTDEFRDYLSDALPPYMIPAYFVRLEQIPYTINGKVMRRDLPNPKSMAGGENKTKPVNRKEAEILDIWKKVLGLDEIGTEDDFFQIGGNSIKGIKIVSAMSENFNIDINRIFSYTTVKKLAEHTEYAKGHLKRIRDMVIDDQTRGINKKDFLLNESAVEKYKASIGHDKVDFNPKKYKNVLVLGATGFLGSHILYELLKTTAANVVVIIRGKNRKEAVQKLGDTIRYYFDDITEEEMGRIRVLNGEVTRPEFGIEKEEYERLAVDTDAVINAAANVRHYGSYEEFYGINAELTAKLVQFALNRSIDIHHISTVGIAAGMVEGRKDLVFTEDDFDIGQKTDNVYAYTKFLGERNLLDARQMEVNANIYRMGNLTGRAKDGFFQKNIGENGFYKIMRAMLSMGIMPDIKENTIDFTYIDEAAKAVTRLVFSDHACNSTYHIQNGKCTSISAIGKWFQELGMKVELMEYTEYLTFLFDHHTDDRYAEDIQTILLHTHMEENVKLSRFRILCDKTEEILRSCGFEWTEPSVREIGSIIRFCETSGFLKMCN